MVIAIIQARMSSTRLPGKVLKEVLGRPLLSYMVERVQHARCLDSVIVATSVEPGDDPIVKWCQQNDVVYERGPLNDVLARFYQVVQKYRPDHIVRLTADCPLMDPAVIDDVVVQHITQGNDYTTNTIAPRLPDGFDVEVMTSDALSRVFNEAKNPLDREHVCRYFNKSGSDEFQCGYLHTDTDKGHIRFTVDYIEDFELVEKIVKTLYPSLQNFSYRDIMDWYDLYQAK
jgi:spore coat polysaccharide biosynthesis protein SpsF